MSDRRNIYPYFMENSEKVKLAADGQFRRVSVVTSSWIVVFSSSGNLANSSIRSIETVPFSIEAYELRRWAIDAPRDTNLRTID
jgi:hypothetical protein